MNSFTFGDENVVCVFDNADKYSKVHKNRYEFISYKPKIEKNNIMIIENIGSKIFKDVKYFKLNTFKDDRGSFKETFNQEIEKFIGTNIHFIQDNESFSKYGVLRGLHYQNNPKEQSKLVRVSSGKIQDVVVDIRKGSATYANWESFDLSDENNGVLFVPKGFAHGFLVLSKSAIVNYKVDNFYQPSLDSGINYNDSNLAIDWNLPNDQIILSDKDKNLPPLDL